MTTVGLESTEAGHTFRDSNKCPDILAQERIILGFDGISIFPEDEPGSIGYPVVHWSAQRLADHREASPALVARVK